MTIVADHTQAFLVEVRRTAVERLKVAADHVAGKAKIEVPVDTGALKNSIHAEIDDENLVARIIADALRKTPGPNGSFSYAWYVETGEGTGAAQPYMRPALHRSLGEIEKIFS